MPWRPLPRIAFAIAVYPFAPSAPADLPLELGDELYIIEEGGIDGAWLRGYLVAPPSLLSGLTSTKGQTLEARVFSGIFPRSCVEIREYIGGDTDLEGELHHATATATATAREHDRDDPANAAAAAAQSPLPRGLVRQPVIPASVIDQSWNHTNGAEPSPPPASVSPISVSDTREGQSSFTNPPSPTNFTPRDERMQKPPAPVPMLKIGDETPTCADEPLVDEIASCLREWHSTNLHELLLSREYGKLTKLTRLMNRLDLARRQLLHGVLTAQELEDLHEQVVWDMVKGNKLVNNEIITRNPKQRGRLLTATDNVLEVTRLTANMALLDSPTKSASEVVNLYHLSVEVTDIVNNIRGSPPTLLVAIYRKVPGESPVRLTENFAAEAPQLDRRSSTKLRTLFTDLTQMDVGEIPGSEAELFLVIKVQANVDVRVPGTTPPKTANGRQSTLPNSDGQAASAENTSKEGGFNRAGRRSLLWGASKINNARKRVQLPTTIDEGGSPQGQAATEKEAQRPTTAKAEERHSSQGSNAAATGPSAAGVQLARAPRDIGVAIVGLKELISSATSSQVEQTLSVFSPSESPNVRDPEHGDWSSVITEIMKSATGRFEDCALVPHIQLKVQSFIAPEVDELIRTTPTALLNVHKTPKIGFPGAPKESRSDIYVTIAEPVLPHNATFAHPHMGSVQLTDGLDKQNLQLTLEVRKANGERVEHCIFPTSNANGVTAWRTTAIQRGTAWRQTIRLAIPAQDVPSCHLIMSIADAPNFPFALAWMPLWTNGAFIEDGPHMPLMYIYDKFTSKQENGRGAYLEMEWNSRPTAANGQPHHSHSERASVLRVETFLCSTEITQDQVLLGVLNWRQQTTENLSLLLRQLPFVQDIEIVKLAVEVWGALFDILTEKSGSEEFEDLVLNNLVMSCSISRDRRFNKDAVITKYIREVFDFSEVSIPLMRSLQRLFERTKDYQNSRHLNSTIKSGHVLGHLVVQSHKLQLARIASQGPTATSAVVHTFQQEIGRLFQAFESLMRSPLPTLIGSKTLLMSHLSEWVSVLRHLIPRQMLWKWGESFIDSTDGVQGKLLLRRLATILEFCKVLEPEKKEPNDGGFSVLQMNEKVRDWIEPYWGKTDKVNEQYREQVRLCASIISTRRSNVIKLVHDFDLKILQSFVCLRDAGRPHKNTLSPLYPQSYPFSYRALDNENPIDEAILELTSALAAYHEWSLAPDVHTPERIMLAFDVMKSIVDGKAYPNSWLTLSLLHHRSCLFAVQKFFTFMQKYMLPEPEQPELFRTDLWKALFTSLLTVVSSENLALETFPEQKRRAVWKIAGDVREVGAGLLARCWNAIGWEVSKSEREHYGLDRLGGWQVQYVPHLVSPIVELCLSVHAGLRATAVQILQSMIISEWSISGDLVVIQHAIVDCLNYLLKHKNMAETAQQKLFIIELMDLFEPLAETNDNELWEAFKDLISVVEDLLDLLVVVHSPDTSDAFRTMNTLRLMDFLRDMQKEDIFISYVHQLAESEAQARCFKEAGLALRLHAEMYDWDTNKTAEALSSPPMPVQTCFERRERLYFEMIRYFEEGAAYGCALECYRELAERYEHTSFDFAKLARTQRSMAKCYELIAKGECQLPRYFKVVYKGLGFPPNLRDKQYIFEGSGSERLVNFTDRLQREHPSARIVSQGDVKDNEGQNLHVTPVTPYRDLKHPLYQRSKVGFSTKEYVLSDSPVNFAVTTRRHSPKTGVRDQWVEKTVYTTAEVFPTILRRSEVIAEEVLPLSPVQTAIERTVRKASELWTLERRLREGDDTSNFNLVDAIRTSVDPASFTSVAQYRGMLSSALSAVNDDEHEEKRSVEDTMQAALKIALFDFAYMLRHCFNTFGRNMPSHEYQKLLAQFNDTFAPEIALLGPPPASAPVHQEQISNLQFSDPTFDVRPPTPPTVVKMETVEAPHPEEADTFPSDVGKPKHLLSSESKTFGRGNRLSMLLKRKPSTNYVSEAEQNGVSGQASAPKLDRERSGFNLRKMAAGTTNSNSHTTDQREAAKSPDMQSPESSQAASRVRSPPKSSGKNAQPAADSDAGGPVYTAIASAKDALKQGGYTGSGAGSVKLARDPQRPSTSQSNGTATTTGRRIAELRKGLAARKLEAESVDEPVPNPAYQKSSVQQMT